jgi:DNA-binding beta-propeller fold protein YncE
MTSFFPVTFDASFRTKEDEELSPPSGLCITHDGSILLADDFNHRIQIYDLQFNLITSFGEKGKEQGQLQYPKGIAVDKEGNIFVADSWNHRIQKFDSQGKPLLSFGSCGDGKGELNEPYDILIDSSETLIVVERYNHRIQFFDSHGKSLGWVGQRGTVLEEELADNYETPFNLLAPPLFEFPTSIATDSLGNYFVTDSGNHRIRKFDNKWQEILTFGEQGDEPGQFQYPLCVSIAANDLLYIADLNNNRIQIFTSFGQYLNVIEHEETPLEAPCLTRIDSAGNLFVGSTFDTKILKYQIPTGTENTLAEKLATSEPLNPEHIYYYSLVQAKK